MRIAPYSASCLLILATGIAASSIAQAGSAPGAKTVDVLDLYQQKSGIPRTVFSRLQEWGALPPWARASATLRNDWLESLHTNVTRAAWPAALRKATVRTIEGGSLSPGLSIKGPHRAIAIFDSTPAYLRELVEIVNFPLVPPESSDPDAKMLLDPGRKEEATRRLARMIGMMEETSYLDGPGSEWGGAVVFGTRFIYYHELGHLSLSLPNATWPEVSLYPEEEQFAEEIYADQFAFSMLALEVRSQQPELQATAFTGMGFAMMLVASSEYAGAEYGDGRRRTKGATLRMGRLAHWARLAVELGTVDRSAPSLLQAYWDQYRDLLRSVQTIPSPSFSLLRQTADRPREEWTIARNHVVRWCAFGDCRRLGSIIGNVYRSALDQSTKEPRAQRVVEVVEFLLDETASLEPDLGLKEAMRKE